MSCGLSRANVRGTHERCNVCGQSIWDHPISSTSQLSSSRYQQSDFLDFEEPLDHNGLNNYSDSRVYCDWSLFFLIIFFLGGAILLIMGGFYVAEVAINPAVCGTSLDSAKFEMTSASSNGYRYLSGNSCPGYDWTNQTSPFYAGAFEFNISIPSQPINCTKAQKIGLDDPVYSTIGISKDGLRIYGPAALEDQDAVIAEGASFDDCGGHVNEDYILVSETITNLAMKNTYSIGYYHRHVAPGTYNSQAQDSSFNLDYTYCSSVSSWFDDDSSQHSPLLGFLADGIPIYGPRGANGHLPVGLDQCNGHSEDKAFYHYHFRSNYPYTVQCLWGYTDGSFSSLLDRSCDSCDSCEVSSVQHDYSSLDNLTWSYGGSGTNSKFSNGTYLNYYGAVSMLVMGCLILLVSLGLIVYYYLYPFCLRERQGYRILSSS